MKTTSAGVIALLATSNEFVRADLYTFTLKNGTVLRYADFDIDLSYGGTTWSAGGPVFQRGLTRTVIGLEVGTLDVELFPKASDTVSGISFIQAAAIGYFDGAQIDLDYALMSPGSTAVLGTVSNFSGTVSDPSITRYGISLTANSPLDALNMQLPRNVCEPSCMHMLFDSGCSLNKASWIVYGAVNGSPTASAFTTNVTRSDGYFDGGTLTFYSGANSGTSCTVKTYVTAYGAVTLNYSLPFVPAFGDSFVAYPGCDKTMVKCNNLFANKDNFKATPFIPIQETAY